MTSNRNSINRREALKRFGLAGIGTATGASILWNSKASGKDTKGEGKRGAGNSKMPRRKLGDTGVTVPALSFGAMFNMMENQVMLHYSLQNGMDYWDTAYGYYNGNSELGIGKFFKDNPGTREKVYLVTKASGASNPQQIDDRLNKSLQRMNTDHVDLYYGIHGMSNPKELTKELREWSEKAKREGRIRHFGFSTHSNMAKCLKAAAENSDWIDAVMVKYNFGHADDQEMQEAVQACYDNGVGITAMKVLRGGPQLKNAENDKLAQQLIEKGYSNAQGKIKYLLEDKRVSTANIRMEDVSNAKENLEAVVDKSNMDAASKDALKKFAYQTCDNYCAGCSDICNAAMPAEMPYISDIMRYLMYHNSYGDVETAKELFYSLPARVKNRLTAYDYSLAESYCPQNIPIARLMQEAAHKLA